MIRCAVIQDSLCAIIEVLFPLNPVPELAGYRHLHHRDLCLFSMVLEPGSQRQVASCQNLKALSPRCLQIWRFPSIELTPFSLLLATDFGLLLRALRVTHRHSLMLGLMSMTFQICKQLRLRVPDGSGNAYLSLKNTAFFGFKYL